MIYLIRHGEAEAGWGQAADPGLSALGREQAEAVARHLGGERIDQIFASPMARCQQTALPFSRLSGLSIGTETAISEIPTPDGLDDRVAWLRGFMAGHWDETLPLLQNWRTKLLETVAAFPDNSAVFTHFIAINTVAGHIRGSNAVTTFRPGHCSVTRIVKRPDGLAIDALGSEAATRVL